MECLMLLLRMGSKEGFANIKRAQVHSVATKVMQCMACNVHENVPEFDQAGFSCLLLSFHHCTNRLLWLPLPCQSQLEQMGQKMDKARLIALQK